MAHITEAIEQGRVRTLKGKYASRIELTKYPGVTMLGRNFESLFVNAAYYPVTILMVLLATNYPGDYYQNLSPASMFLPKKTGKIELGIILALFASDDVSTAIGMQSEETQAIEGNLMFSNYMKEMVDKGYCRTHSQAMLWINLGVSAIIILWWYKWGLKPISKAVLYVYGIYKNRAGWAWNSIANDYDWGDYFTLITGTEGQPQEMHVNILKIEEWLDANGGTQRWLDANGRFDPVKGMAWKGHSS